MTTNIAVNSRSLNGIILISDGNGTEISEGNITTNDINSNSLNTNQLNTTLLNVSGKIECNSDGAYSIPTSISSITGLLIGYGHTTNSGATDFLNYQSSYTSTQGGFRFWNKSNTQTLTNLAIIDNSQTYFKSQLIGCTAETPLNNTSIVNKTYADSNFMFKTGSVEESITGNKTFSGSLISNNLTASVITGAQNIYSNVTTGTINIGSGQTTGTINIGANQTTGIVNIGNETSQTQIKSVLRILDLNGVFGVRLQLSQVSGVSNYNSYAGATTATTHNFFSYNNTGLQKNGFQISYSAVTITEGLILTCRQIRSTNTSSGSHELFSNMIAGGVLTIGSSTSSVINNSFTTNNSAHIFNNYAPKSNIAPTDPLHLTTKAYVDGMPVHGILNSSNIWTGTNSYNTYLPTSTLTPTNPSDLVTKQYVDGMPIHGVLNSNNIWGGTNSYSNYLPTSTLTPSNPSDFTTKSFTDGAYQTIANMVNYANLSNTNTFTNTNVFNAQTTFNNTTPFSNATPPTANNHLTRKDYVDTNFMYKTGNVAENINGVKTFFNRVNCSGGTALVVSGLAQFNGTTEFGAQTYFNNLAPFSYIAPTDPNHIPNKNYCDTTFQTIAGMSSYLLSATASTTYLSIANAVSTYQTIANMTNYLTTATASTTYLSIANAVSTYQTIAGMSSYLLSATASTTYLSIANAVSTYQTIANMTNYLLASTASTTYLSIANAVSTYQTIANMTNYLLASTASTTYIDFSTDQTISASNKRFAGLHTTALNISPILGGGGNKQQIYVSGTTLEFVPQFNNNVFKFNTKDGASTQTNPLTISSATTTISNALSITGLATFSNGAVYNTILPTSIISATSPNEFTIKSYTDATYQTIANMSIYLTIATASTTYLLISTASSTYQTIANMTNYLTTTNAASTYLSITNAASTYQTIAGMSSYLLASTAASTYQTIANMTNYLTTATASTTYLTITNASSTYQTIANMTNYLTTATASTTYLTITSAASTYQTIAGMSSYLLSSTASSTYQTIANMVNYANLSSANTFTNINTFNSTLKTNNITATTSSIAGVNNIYTNLDPVNGFGIVNIGTFQNNINIKCNLNINESVYGTTQNTVLNMEGNSLRFTNNGSTNGNYIFTINESGTYNPLIVNKTSVNIGGDLTVGGELSLYDTTPSTKSVIISLLNNDVILDPNNTFSTTYNFKVNDSGGGTTTPLTISTASTTINNNLISNSQATFNTVCPISSISPTAVNHLTRKDYVDLFQPLAGMSSYLTTTSASTTYQTIVGMSSYLTTFIASATYQTISGMSSYLTTATASATYATIASLGSYQPIVVGSIIQMAVGTTPSGYLQCNGASLSTTTYSALFNVIGYTYGGSGTNFNVPDFRGIFLRGNGTNGFDSAYASAGYGSLQTDGIKAHTHDILFGYNQNVQGSGGSFNCYSSTSPNYNNPGTGAGRATGLTSNNANPYPDTRPGNFAVLFCIKY